MDIASLAIQINTSDVSRAGQELAKLAGAGKKVEQAASGIAAATKTDLGSAATTWKQFISERLSDYRKLEGGHAEAMRRIAAEWKQHRESFNSGLTPAQLGDATRAFTDNSEAMRQAGLSAGQYQQAIRMLPMQLTDVVTSLASGMPLWMVAIQQGGQVRDSFGGIGNAARAVVSEIGPLNLGLAAAATTVGAAILAFEKGQREMSAFNEALILTGNHAGITASQLTDMAREMDAMTGVTQSSASAALAQVVASGQFAGKQIGLVATAAEQMRVATGRSIEETIAEFVKLGDDPVKTLLDLNDKYHFLTSAQLDQIRTLQEQNRQQDAATEAMRLYAGTIAERTPQVLSNLGSLERAWLRIKQMAGEAVDAVLEIGRPGSLTEQIAQVEAELQRNRNREHRSFDDDFNASELEKRLAYLRKQVEQERQASAAATVDTTAERSRQQAQEAWERRTLRYASDRKKLEEEIKQIRIDGLKAGIAQPEIDARIAAATKEYEERQARANRPRAFTDDAATRMLQGLREQEASLQAQLSSTVTLTAAQRAQVEWAQQLADLKEKKILTADQKSLLAGQDAITAQMAKVVALDDERRKREEIAKLAERAAEVDRSVASSLASQREQYNQQLSVFGMGRDARERVQSEASIRQQYQRLQERLNEDMGPGQFNTEQYRQASANIRKGLDEALAANADYYSQLEEMQGDWRVGARAAYADYLSDARNVAGMTEDLFRSSFSGMEDAIAQFATTGKLSFADFTRSILADMARIAARQASSSILSGLGGAALSSLGSLFGGNTAGSSIADYTSIDFSNFVSGQRASGGSVGPNSLYQVNELGPELLSQNGKTYLMTGEQGGSITPLSGGANLRALGGGGSAAGTPIVINAPVTVQAQPGMSGQEAASQGAQMGQAMTAEIRRVISSELRAGGLIWRANNGR
ncbi:phage tail tape measure protein [Azotobacter vinelandii]|uniref:phage tail tape measure protein n=1 Tax=Azotobacter vinelandii TaxID=354 RepID=UPI002665F9BF|nr:phage tail tape measure protein [Azotobacter vinelandii]WKN20793.1 phage tail tape measure protein [Azotobacter vinelandii]